MRLFLAALSRHLNKHDGVVAISSDYSLILRLSSQTHSRFRPRTTYPLRRTRSPSLSLSLSAMAVGSFVGAALVVKVGLWEKQSLVAVVRGLEMYEQADLARGRWVHHGSEGEFR